MNHPATPAPTHHRHPRARSERRRADVQLGQVRRSLRLPLGLRRATPHRRPEAFLGGTSELANDWPGFLRAPGHRRPRPVLRGRIRGLDPTLSRGARASTRGRARAIPSPADAGEDAGGRGAGAAPVVAPVVAPRGGVQSRGDGWPGGGLERPRDPKRPSTRGRRRRCRRRSRPRLGPGLQALHHPAARPSRVFPGRRGFSTRIGWATYPGLTRDGDPPGSSAPLPGKGPQQEQGKSHREALAYTGP